MKKLILLVCLCAIGCGDPPVVKRHKEIIDRLDNIEKAIRHR